MTVKELEKLQASLSDKRAEIAENLGRYKSLEEQILQEGKSLSLGSSLPDIESNLEKELSELEVEIQDTESKIKEHLKELGEEYV